MNPIGRIDNFGRLSVPNREGTRVHIHYWRQNWCMEKKGGGTTNQGHRRRRAHIRQSWRNSVDEALPDREQHSIDNDMECSPPLACYQNGKRGEAGRCRPTIEGNQRPCMGGCPQNRRQLCQLATWKLCGGTVRRCCFDKLHLCSPVDAKAKQTTNAEIDLGTKMLSDYEPDFFFEEDKM